MPGKLPRGGDICVVLKSEQKFSRQRNGRQSIPGSMRQHEQRPEARNEIVIFEDQKIILHSWTERYVGAWLAKKPKCGTRLLRTLQTTLICSTGSRELRRGVSQDSPPIFGDPKDDFPVALSWITPNVKSLLLCPPVPRFWSPLPPHPAITGRAQGWVTSVLLPVQGWKVRDA